MYIGIYEYMVAVLRLKKIQLIVSEVLNIAVEYPDD
jgi:hypothetical protein